MLGARGEHEKVVAELVTVDEFHQPLGRIDIVAVGVVERLRHELFLDVPNRLVELRTCRGRCHAGFSDGLRQIVWQHLLRGPQHDRPLDCIFKFANVTRPGIPLQ